VRPLLLALAVIAAETALHLDHWWVGGVVVAAVLLRRYVGAAPVFVAALALSWLAPGGCYVLLLWAAYHAGREITSRWGIVVVIGASAGALAAQLAQAPDPRWIAAFLIFVALPFLVGRYLAQHERLVATLSLNERLRIARDMHDSLGHRLSLVSVQAAALEVSDDLPPKHKEAVAQLARSARDAMDELYELVGALRGQAAALPGLAAVDELVREYRDAGVAVEVEEAGARKPLPEAASHAAYRVVEEGLTNAAKHAPGQPVRLRMAWEPDALLLSLANPVAAPGVAGGHGLNGLHERVGHAGGLLDHRAEGGEFRLVAMFPATVKPSRTKAVAIGVAVAILMFVFLPASLMVGVSR
jgi:signal transduction histidine kinase